jgi:acetyltransferase-like isoleucine patch superfamily enzyme
MKQKLKRIFKLICSIFYITFSPKLFHFLDLIRNHIYSIWKSNEFQKTGSSFYIKYPSYLHGGKYITVGEGFGCNHFLKLEAIDEFLGEKFTPQIIIGDNVSIQQYCHIGAINKIVIGNNVLIASRVFITDHSHGNIKKEVISLPPAVRKLHSKGPVFIENNVWLGEGVVVLPNVTIGENSIIGANSVVTKSIPKNSIVVGNPARIIKILQENV